MNLNQNLDGTKKSEYNWLRNYNYDSLKTKGEYIMKINENIWKFIIKLFLYKAKKEDQSVNYIIPGSENFKKTDCFFLISSLVRKHINKI